MQLKTLKGTIMKQKKCPYSKLDLASGMGSFEQTFHAGFCQECLLQEL